MAEPDVAIRVAFAWANSALLLAVAAYLAFVPPADRAKRLLALYIALIGLTGLTLVGLVQPDATAEPLRRTGTTLGLLSGFVLVAFLWVYPRPPPLRSLHTVLFAFAGAFALLLLGLWWLDRPALQDDAGGFTFLWQVLRTGAFSSGFGGTTALLLASALWRTRALPAPQQRAALTLLVVVMVQAFTVQGQALADALGEAAGVATGFSASVAALVAWPGDCCGLALALSFAATALVWGAAAALAWKRRHWLAAGFIFLGAALHAAFSLAPVSLLTGTNFAVAAIGTLYAVHRHHALPAAPVPAAVYHLLAAAALASVFLHAAAGALWVLPEAPLALAVGIFLGLALGAAAAALVHPWGLAQVFRRDAVDTDEGRRRVAAYRAALQAEQATGLAGDALRAKLQPLRAELGLSDREHALLEHAVRGGGGSDARGAGTLEPGQRFLDRYTVLRRLGAGGAGTTYLCRDEQVGREVVVKRLHGGGGGPDGPAAVLREARAVGALRHERIVTLFDVEQLGKEVVLVMEHLEGGSLAARLAQGPLPPERFRVVAGDLLEALGAAHAAGLVHRDVKPANLLLTADGRAKLGDFGLAWPAAGDATYHAATAGPAAGTAQYMSPEQARGRACTPRSDLFSAAATLHEALTGRPYLEAEAGESAVELQLRAAAGRPFRAARSPPALRRWFAKALHPDPAQRFASAEAMRSALEEALERSSSPRGRARRPREAADDP